MTAYINSPRCISPAPKKSDRCRNKQHGFRVGTFEEQLKPPIEDEKLVEITRSRPQ